MKRHAAALAIQVGAVNPSGIAHSIVDACAEIRAAPDYRGTESLTSDPAIRLMVHQLAYICGVASGVEGFAKDSGPASYSEAMKMCREAQAS